MKRTAEKAPRRESVYLTVSELADQWRIDRNGIYGMASGTDDPLPIRYLGGRVRSGVIDVSELRAWVARNSKLYGERAGA